MQVFDSAKGFKIDLAKNGTSQGSSGPFRSVVTIGNFDGVHLGHQELLKTVKTQATAAGLASVVYTFHPHPVKVLYPERKTERMFDLRDQREQFEKFGIDYVITENFSPAFSKIGAYQFLNEYIFEALHPKVLVVGHDFNFGSKREGNLKFLESFCAEKGIQLFIIPPFQLNATTVSSSRIRDELKFGETQQAAVFLGRNYYLRGTIEKGFQRGRLIGVPTANIHPDVEFIPRKGVYITRVFLQDQTLNSITNIGINPTFEEAGSVKPIKIETHLFDFSGEIYGQEMRVELLQFIRDEKKFSGIDELRDQIQKDILTAKAYFENH